MAQTSLDIDDLLGHPHAGVVLTYNPGAGRSRREWRSWISEDFSIGAQATYTSPFEDMLEGVTELLGKAKVVSEGGVDEAAQDIGGFSLDTARSPKALTHVWSSSERPTMDVTMAFITTTLEGENPQGNPQDQAASLAALCLPGLGQSGDSITFTTPGGYTPRQERNPPGTFSLKVGGWFHATGLVLTSADITLSMQRMSNGWPLYAEVSASLEPYRLISEAEFREWFLLGATAVEGG